MGKYIEDLNTGGNAQVVATGGVNNLGLDGAFKYVFFAVDGQEFASVNAAKVQANWDADAVSGDLVYLGKCKFEDQSQEAQFFTDQALEINEETIAASKVTRAIQQVNAAVHAELKKMDGKSGRVYFLTTNNIVVGRIDDDGDVKGLPCSISVSNRTLPTTDQPVEYTQTDISFTDTDGDEANPCRFKIDWLFSEVDQVYGLSGAISNQVSGGSFTFDLDLTKTGSNDGLAGAVLADFVVEDEDGNVLVHALVDNGGGNYSFTITTGLDTVYVKFDGRRDVASAGVYYYLDTLIATTA